MIYIKTINNHIWPLLFFAAFTTMTTTHAQTFDAMGGLFPPIKEDAVFYFQVVPDQQGTDHIINTLVGLSEGPMQAYADASAILRFNKNDVQKLLDVYDNDDALSNKYTSTNDVQIIYDQTYHCWFDIHFFAGTYSVYVQTPAMSSPILVHGDAIFRKKDIRALSYWNLVRSSTNELLLKNAGVVDKVGDFATNWLILKSAMGELDNENLLISNIPATPIADFITGIDLWGSASIKLLNNANQEVDLSSTEALTEGMKLQIEGLQTSLYTLELRETSSANIITALFEASIDDQSNIVSGIYSDLSVRQLKGGINVSEGATFRILSNTNKEITADSVLLTGIFKIEVKAEDGSINIYTAVIGSDAFPVTTITNSNETYIQIPPKKYDLEGSVVWHVKSGENPMNGSILNLKSEDIWIYFDNIKPQTILDHHFDGIKVNGQAPVLDENLRLVQYGEGSVIISHGSAYGALTVFDKIDLKGDSLTIEPYTFYKTNGLGALADNIESFILRKGYMATFAEDVNGTGSSKVYIADEEDLLINSLPSALQNSISFIKVIPWRWVSKKSFADGSYSKNEILNCSWRYNWDNTASSSLNIEYVPMRHNPNWPAYANMINKRNVTHALHFNEPDNSVDDGFATVETAIAQWPNMLESGLRLGSPAPTDGGLGWLYEFLDQCKAKNYRVDFVAVHFYRGGQSVTQYYNFLKSIHDRTGLPIWVTEWNNGANWTCCLPTYEAQAETIDKWVDMLENAPFVERYALYGRVQAERQMFYSGTENLTPAGEVYRNKKSNLAYTTKTGHINNPYPAKGAKNLQKTITLTWNPRPGTTAQQLYFGAQWPPAFESHLDEKTSEYVLSNLDYNKTYYWRVDAFNAGSFVTGDSLEFSTSTFLKASSPVPAHGETGVDIGATFLWKSDSLQSELHKLYLGTNPDDLQFETTLLNDLTSYNRPDVMGDLKAGTTYYWRVDEHFQTLDGEYVITGDVWSFTTSGELSNTQNRHSVAVFPNPASDALIIKGLNGSEQVDILNVLGQKVHTTKTTGYLDISQLSPAIYLIKVPQNEQTIRVIKK